MAKGFYTQDEATKKLGMSADQLKIAVRDGKLREFRDGGKVTYKADEVDRLAAAEEAIAGDALTHGSLSGSLADLDNLSTAELTLEDSSSASQSDSLELRLSDDDDSVAGGSIGDAISLAMDDATGGPGGSTGGTAELILEPEAQDDSGIQLGTGADAVSLDDTTASGEDDEKEGTVVSSIGISVFDDDDVEQDADPLAQTVVSDGSEALGIDAAGSGSGLLDLTRESDDTSLGAELLDEIYPGDDSSEMGEATRAGLENAIPETSSSASDEFAPALDEATPAAVAAAPRAAAPVSYGPDPVATGLTGMMFVGVLVMCLAGLTAAAALQGVWPSILDTVFSKLMIVAGAALGAAVIALVIGFFVGKRSS
ncbi:MAG: hypothetical protein H6817_02300 [Phycisphaerales bacterium]|nr:hypothetical protein [Phycisphaerales bacterium]